MALSIDKDGQVIRWEPGSSALDLPNRMHPSITDKRIVNAVKRDEGIGFCRACGRKAKGFVEPDAEHYPCAFKSCGQAEVFGAEQLLLMTVG